MRLLDDFFNIVAEENCDGVYRCKVRLNAQHGLYKVHFPGNPVTPGVCLVQMATELLERQHQKKYLLSRAANIKFRKTIGPDEEPTFVFTKVIREGDELKVTASIEDDETQLVKMSLLFKTVS